MKSLRNFGLTLFFFIGLLSPSCDITDDDDCNCEASRYFNIEGLGLWAYLDENQGVQVAEGQTLLLDEFEGFYLDYLVDYHAVLEPRKGASFNWINTALACTCIPGFDGSKEEELESFQVVTLNDFDDDHLAGSTINEFFAYRGGYFNTADQPLEDFLDMEQQGKLMFEDMRLRIEQAPALDAVLHLRFELKLSNGEAYEVENEPFVLLPN